LAAQRGGIRASHLFKISMPFYLEPAGVACRPTT
jgi:hypothetical protein